MSSWHHPVHQSSDYPAKLAEIQFFLSKMWVEGWVWAAEFVTMVICESKLQDGLPFLIDNVLGINVHWCEEDAWDAVWFTVAPLRFPNAITSSTPCPCASSGMSVTSQLDPFSMRQWNVDQFGCRWRIQLNVSVSQCFGIPIHRPKVFSIGCWVHCPVILLTSVCSSSCSLLLGNGQRRIMGVPWVLTVC